jgi:hypothetical protein
MARPRVEVGENPAGFQLVASGFSRCAASVRNEGRGLFSQLMVVPGVPLSDKLLSVIFLRCLRLLALSCASWRASAARSAFSRVLFGLNVDSLGHRHGFSRRARLDLRLSTQDRTTEKV